MDVRRAVAAVVLLGLLVGCSEDEPGADPPQPTGSATVSPSPPAEPVIPPAAKGTDEASAKAFVRYWFEVLNFSFNSGSSDRLVKLSASGCISCDALRKNIRDAYEGGGQVRAVGWEPISIRRLVNHSSTVFRLDVRQGEEEYLDSSGELVRHFAGGRRVMTMQLAQSGSSWRVQQLDIKR